MTKQAYTSMVKFTPNGRPFVSDIHHLFSALILQTTMGTHRHLFRQYHHTITTQELVASAAALCITHTVRKAGAKDSQQERGTLTHTTTTFHMDASTTKSLGQHLVSARLLENAVDRTINTFRDQTLWQLTTKAICIIQDFCLHHKLVDKLRGLQQHVAHLETADVIMIDRSPAADQFVITRSKASVLFKRMVVDLSLKEELVRRTKSKSERGSRPSSVSSSGSTGSAPIPLSTSSPPSPSPSVHLLETRLISLDNRQMHAQDRMSEAILARQIRTRFPSQSCCDWLLDRCTLVSVGEAETVTAMFVRFGWMTTEGTTESTAASDVTVHSSRSTWLKLTVDGRQLVFDYTKASGPLAPADRSQPRSSEADTGDDDSLRRVRTGPTAGSDAGLTKLRTILDDPQLRSLFREFLAANFCAENLDFWIEYSTLRRKCRESGLNMPSQNQRDHLEDAFALWKMYIAPGALYELNVDETLREEMARLVSSVVSTVDGVQIINTAPSYAHSIHMMLRSLDRIEQHILRLIAADSLPRFLRTPQYMNCQKQKEEEQHQHQHQ